MKKDTIRLIVQAASFALTNGYLKGFASGKIFKGDSKKICLPGLNCYSCPGALFSCPIGALQAVLGDSRYKISLYVLGVIGLFGVIFGRFICGWMCPFGLIQDLLYRIPFVKKLKSLPGHKVLKYIKYIILIVFVIALPIAVVNVTGIGQPWFCEYICPSGTLFGGIPLVISNKILQDAIGWRFFMKISILVIILMASIIIYRPFCKYLCPLGAIYGLFNIVSFIRYNINTDKCTDCRACVKVCKMDVNVRKNPNSTECIRCGNCLDVCKNEALTINIKEMVKKRKNEENSDNLK